MLPHYLVKCATFSSDWRYIAFLQTLVALKKAGCGLALVAVKRTSCDVWQMECQASNITANVQSDHILHGYMLPVFFATDQLHRPPRSAEIQPVSQQDASATRPYFQTFEKLVKKWKKMKIRKYSEVCMNNTVEKVIFGFPKVQWLQYTGELVGQMSKLLMSNFLRI